MISTTNIQGEFNETRRWCTHIEHMLKGEADRQRWGDARIEIYERDGEMGINKWVK